MSRSRLLAALALALALPASAVETRRATHGAGELWRGKADGVAVTARGAFFLAPESRRLDDGGEAISTTSHIWAMVRDGAGNVYAGTGPEGRILKLSPSGRTQVLFTVDEPIVSALAMSSDGTLLAGTAPGGLVYKIRGDGDGAVWSETGARYVWSLLATDDGRVYAGTGDAGGVMEIEADGSARPLFGTTDAHVTTLAAGPDGGLLAGGAPHGRVYRIDREGRGEVLLQGNLHEARAVAVGARGTVYAAWVAAPRAEPRRPAVRIQLPESASGADAVGDVTENGGTLQGVIEGLPGEAQERDAGLVGQIVRLDADGTAVELWASDQERPYALWLDAAGRPLFATGEPARLYRVEPDGDVALLAEFDQAQASALVAVGNWIAVGTSSPAAVHRLDREPRSSGSLVAPPLDARSASRWGSLAWTTRGRPGRVEFAVRSGNTSAPDGSWSDWSAPLTVADGSPFTVPDGRFVQWRSRLFGRESAEGRVHSVSAAFTPYNREPRIDGWQLEGNRRATAGSIELRASVSDPDGDPLVVHAEYLDAASGEWRPGARSELLEPSRHGHFPEARLRVETGELPEGAYEMRALVSDARANDPREAKRVPAPGTLRVVVDRTGPGLAWRRLPDGTLEVDATDDRAGVERLELVDADGDVLFRVLPVDGVCDGLRERFVIAAEHLDGRAAGLRVTDAAGNRADDTLGPPSGG